MFDADFVRLAFYVVFLFSILERRPFGPLFLILSPLLSLLVIASPPMLDGSSLSIPLHISASVELVRVLFRGSRQRHTD